MVLHRCTISRPRFGPSSAQTRMNTELTGLTRNGNWDGPTARCGCPPGDEAIPVFFRGNPSNPCPSVPRGEASPLGHLPAGPEELLGGQAIARQDLDAPD